MIKNKKKNQSKNKILGQDIRNLRKQKGLTISELANKADISIGVISQIERNLTTPSMKTLFAITKILNIPIGWLLNDNQEIDNDEFDIIVRSNKRRKVDLKDGITEEILTPRFSGNLQLMLVKIESGGGSDREGYTHKGEEAGYVIEGVIDLTIDKKTYNLKIGDSFKFESNKKHTFYNPGKEKCVILWANTPAIF